jgi:hypothetical protein
MLKSTFTGKCFYPSHAGMGGFIYSPSGRIIGTIEHAP